MRQEYFFFHFLFLKFSGGEKRIFFFHFLFLTFSGGETRICFYIHFLFLKFSGSETRICFFFWWWDGNISKVSPADNMLVVRPEYSAQTANKTIVIFLEVFKMQSFVLSSVRFVWFGRKEGQALLCIASEEEKNSFIYFLFRKSKIPRTILTWVLL